LPASSESDQSRIPHILFHLIHPVCLGMLHSLLNHVKHFRGSLGGHSTSAETAQVAKDVLLDLVDYSAIDLLKLEPLLLQFGYELKTLDRVFPAFLVLDALINLVDSCSHRSSSKLNSLQAFPKLEASASKVREHDRLVTSS
jgi:hypothetical protein